MTMILPQAAPASPEPSFTSTSDARSLSESDATFGPALSDARDRLASSDDRGTGEIDRRDNGHRTEPNNRGERVDRRSEPGADRPTRADGSDDSAEAAGSDDNTPVDEASEGEETEDATTVGNEASSDALTSNDASATAMALVSPIHPTAKGTTGGGDRPIDLTIGAVVPSEDANVAEITAAMNEAVDAELSAVVGDDISSDVAALGRQAALTSLDQVADADLSLAERVQSASTEEVVGPSIGAEDGDRANPFSEVQTGDRAEASSEVETAEVVTDQAGTEAMVDQSAVAEPVEGAVVESAAVDRPVQQGTIGTTSRTDNANAVVVLAQEATTSADALRATASTAAAATAELPTAEANLWDDVRSAFDRIRTTGDGQEVRIRLRPAELGELLVQVRTQGDNVSVKLVASSAAAHQTLVDDRLRLAAELARAGFDEGSVNIGQQTAGDADPGSRSQDGEDGRDRSAHSIGGLDQVGETREILEQRDPIRTESGFRPGRTAQSTINLTL